MYIFEICNSIGSKLTLQYQCCQEINLPRRGKLAFGRPKLAYGVITARFHTLQKKSVLVRLGAHVYKVHLTKNRTK